MEGKAKELRVEQAERQPGRPLYWGDAVLKEHWSSQAELIEDTTLF